MVGCRKHGPPLCSAGIGDGILSGLHEVSGGLLTFVLSPLSSSEGGEIRDCVYVSVKLMEPLHFPLGGGGMTRK